MNQIARLLHDYRAFVHLPWTQNLAGIQRVWFVVYHPSDERRIRAQIKEFEASTLEAKHKWSLIDITDVPANWIVHHEYRLGYFRDPEAIAAVEEDLRHEIASILAIGLCRPEVDDNTVVAMLGTGTVFGFSSVSAIISEVDSKIKGRLLVFFPGEFDHNQYRFMDARDGFNYMAVPITGSARMQI